MTETTFILKQNVDDFVRNNKKAEQSWKKTAGTIGTDTKKAAISVTKSLNKIETANNKTSKSFSSLGLAAAGNIKTIASAAAIISGAVVTSAINPFTKFELSLTKVGITTGETSGELARLGDDIQELGEKTGIGADKLLIIAENAGALGISGRESILAFVEAFAQLEEISDIKGFDGAQQIIKILDATGEGVGGINRFTNALVGASNASAVFTEKQLLSVAGAVSQAGRSFGLSSRQIVAISAGFASIGVSAGDAASATESALGAIEKAINSGGAEMKALEKITNKTREEFSLLFNADKSAALELFFEGLSKAEANGADLTVALKKLGVENNKSTGAIIAATKEIYKYSEAVKRSGKASKANNARILRFEKLMKTQSKAVKKAGAAITRLAQEFGELISPAVIGGLNIVSGAFNYMAEGVEALNTGLRENELLIFKFINFLASGTGFILTFGPFKALLNPIDTYNKLIGKTTGETEKAARATTKSSEIIFNQIQKVAEASRKAANAAKEKSEAIQKAVKDEAAAVDKSIKQQIGAIDKQIGKLNDSLDAVESIREQLKNAFAEVSAAPQADGKVGYADISAASSEARKAFVLAQQAKEAGNPEESLKQLNNAINLASKGIEVISQLRKQGDISGLQATGALKVLESIVKPAAEALEAQSVDKLFELQKIADSLSEIKVGLDLDSVKAAAEQLQKIFNEKLKGLKIPGQTDLSGVAAATEAGLALPNTTEASRAALAKFAALKIQGVDDDPILKNAAAKKIDLNITLDSKQFATDAVDAGRKFTDTLNLILKQAAAE